MGSYQDWSIALDCNTSFPSSSWGDFMHYSLKYHYLCYACIHVHDDMYARACACMLAGGDVSHIFWEQYIPVSTSMREGGRCFPHLLGTIYPASTSMWERPFPHTSWILYPFHVSYLAPLPLPGNYTPFFLSMLCFLPNFYMRDISVLYPCHVSYPAPVPFPVSLHKRKRRLDSWRIHVESFQAYIYAILLLFILMPTHCSMLYFCYLPLCLNFQCQCSASCTVILVKLVESMWYGRDRLRIFFFKVNQLSYVICQIFISWTFLVFVLVLSLLVCIWYRSFHIWMIFLIPF